MREIINPFDGRVMCRVPDATAADVGRGDEDLAVETARPQQGGIELLDEVRGRDHDHAVGRAEAVHLDQ